MPKDKDKEKEIATELPKNNVNSRIKVLASDLAKEGMRAGVFENFDSAKVADYCIDVAKKIYFFDIDSPDDNPVDTTDDA